jgi:iron complex outermembrane receptor protein
VNGTDYYVPAGELTHTGFELQAIGQIMPNWQINASYTYLDPKITQSVPALSATAGETELFIPKQTASAYTTYTLKEGRLRGLSLGGGIRYVGSEHTSYTSLLANQEENPNTQTPPIIPTKDLAGYAVVDATIGYTIDKWLVQLNGHNILDRRYYINTYQTLYYGNVAGDPANIALSVRRTF